MKTIPGPWFSEPWWRKALLWTRYRVPSACAFPYRAAVATAYWGTHPKTAGCIPSGYRILPLKTYLGILWRQHEHAMGRYYRLEFPE